MAKFLAITSLGLRDILEEELVTLGLKVISKDNAGVTFESNWAGCYRANLCSRVATKILLPILDFPAYKPEDLYHNVRRHDFTKYIQADQTISIDAHTRESALHDQRLVAMKTKDAIVDQFRDKFSTRPSVERYHPDLEIIVRIVSNQVSVAINTSGDSLSMRGYRKQSVEAPLREHLAAGLLAMTGWDGNEPIVDPMCGSGTFLIEGALKALNVAPGTFRRSFAFQKHLTFQESVWSQVLDEVVAGELENIPCKLYGFDRDGKAIQAANKNAEIAGVDTSIVFSKGHVTTLEPPLGVSTGIVIVNPPYGERMGVTEQLKDVYRDLAFSLKQHFKGWRLYVLSGNEELTGSLRLKASRKWRVHNGSLDCRFLEYKIR